jgi:hypothetical protein
MAIQNINLGTYSNDGTGDDLRTAFEKVKSNFIELYSTVFGANVGTSPPISGVEQGELWWSTVEGRLYLYYGTAWVDASPVDGFVTYDLTAETATGGATLRLNGTNLSVDNIKIASGTNITVARTDASTITVNADSIGINTLTDVDTITAAPTTGQALVWNGTTWVPGSVAVESGNNNFNFGGFNKVFTDPISYLLDKTGIDMGTFALPAEESVDLGTF